jgi:hypothetical protein
MANNTQIHITSLNFKFHENIVTVQEFNNVISGATYDTVEFWCYIHELVLKVYSLLFFLTLPSFPMAFAI